MKNLSKVYVGVDISKNNLDVYIHPIGKRCSFINSENGLTHFLKLISEYEVTQIVCEATGGYENLLAQYLRSHSYPLWIVDPRRIKGFIIASGCRGKNRQNRCQENC